MMDNGDFTVPKWEELDCKCPDESNEDHSRCSTPASAVTDDGSLKSVSESILFKQLHSEIDVTQCLLSGTDGLEAYLQSKVKPMLEQIHAAANKVVVNCKDVGDLRKGPQDRNILLHCPSLQELLLKLGFSKNTEEIQDYLISSDRVCWLSEIEALKMELKDTQCRHEAVVKGLHLSLRSTEQKNKNSQMVLQRSLGQSQEKLHSLEQSLKEYEVEVASLQHSLMESNDKSQSLLKSLLAANIRIQSSQQDQEESEKRVQNLQLDLMVTKENNQVLQEKLVFSDENVKSLRQNVNDLENEFRHSQWASEEKVKSLQQALSSSEQEAGSLQQSLKTSEEKVVSLQNNHWALEEKLQSVQDNLSSSEGRARFLQNSLRSTEEKSKLLDESLGASEEKSQALQESLTVREQQLSVAMAQRQSLEKCKGQQEDRIQSLVQSLAAVDKHHSTTVLEMEKSVMSSREKVEILQGALDRADTMHQREVGQLQQILNRTVQKKDSIEQELRGNVSVLSSKLLEEETKASKEIERSFKYERELQDTIMDLRQKLKAQTDGREFAQESLKSRQKELAELQRLLEVDLLRCRSSCQQAKEQKSPTNIRQSNLKVDLMNLKSGLYSVLEKESMKDEQRRQDWVKVLDKSKEWEQRAEKLVDSLDCHQLLKEGGKEREQHRGGGSPYFAASLPLRNRSSRPSSPYTYGHKSVEEKLFDSGSQWGVRDSGCVRHLQTVQKRLKHLQSVDFQRSIKGLLRMS
ncbi:putative WEB family protein At1g65010, chloroplastic isoform X2 [Hypomesus transpacificus]|uniref:putative WEB family protein At1g65010, chloroplastic isoform X2 n=1 Tax=Hypomesus transpacificus TaxID=137520 RepID=UPI001F07CD9B|nr:putative WEB family protein At1g65010, chloroplastic isoform X2 [Hypomesus transpacificus]